MSFFQNLFNSEFRGNWNLDDKKYSLTFACPANVNSSNFQSTYNVGPWNLSGIETLTLNYAYDPEFKNYSALSIDVSGTNSSATTANEVCNKLNSDETFASMFIASIKGFSVLIAAKSNRNKSEIKLWISNSGAEQSLGFNKKAGVSEMPSYFARHTIENRFNFSDSAGQLILLDENDPIDQKIIENAGLSPYGMRQDWELIAGKASGLFTCQKLTIDNQDRITQIIEYPTGSAVGAFARKINYVYSGSNINPDIVTEIPHVLSSNDLVNIAVPTRTPIPTHTPTPTPTRTSTPTPTPTLTPTPMDI